MEPADDRKYHLNEIEFIGSFTDLRDCPVPELPEYAFTGRSNVGKSSLINMITGRRSLAKVSGRPGKTLLINYFRIGEEWYLVDLPGYGFAKVSKKERERIDGMMRTYISGRSSLACVFQLIDCRLPLQSNDLAFMQWMAENGVPFAIIYTKSDKLGTGTLRSNIAAIERELKKFWSPLPPSFISSSATALGREAVLDFIFETNHRIKEMRGLDPGNAG